MILSIRHRILPGNQDDLGGWGLYKAFGDYQTGEENGRLGSVVAEPCVTSSRRELGKRRERVT